MPYRLSLKLLLSLIPFKVLIYGNLWCLNILIVFFAISCAKSKNLIFSSIFTLKGKVETNIPIICFSLKFDLFKEGVPITISFFSVILYIYVERAVRNITYGEILLFLQ